MEEESASGRASPQEEEKFMENQQSDDDEQASQLVKVYPEEIMGKFRSKSDIYNYLSQKWQLFLSPFKEAKIEFLRSLLNGTKQAIKVKDVCPFNVPRYPELSVKQLWQLASNNDKVNKYFPTYAEGKVPSAKFFYGVLSSVVPDFLEESIQECIHNRNIVCQDESNDDFIEMKKEIYDAISRDKWISRSNGRGLYLLKKNAKDVVHRNRKQPRNLSEAIKDKLKDI